MQVYILGCWGAFPKAGEACSGVLVCVGGKNFLLDLGCGVYPELLKQIPAAELSGVFLSHLHYDHMSDMGALRYHYDYLTRTGQRDGRLDVFAPNKPWELFRQMESPFLNVQPAREGSLYERDGVRITAIPVEHTIACFAYCIEAYGKKVVYYTDTIYRPQDEPFIRNADLFICEATRTQESRHTVGAGHMTDYEAGKMAALSDVKALCLYHLPGDAQMERIYENAKTEFQGSVYIAQRDRRFVV